MVCHWVGRSKMKPIDVEELFNRKVVIDELETNLNDNDKTEALVVSEEIQEDASVNTKRKKIGRTVPANQDEDSL